jgi:hypothetical protein
MGRLRLYSIRKAPPADPPFEKYVDVAGAA